MKKYLATNLRRNLNNIYILKTLIKEKRITLKLARAQS